MCGIASVQCQCCSKLRNVHGILYNVNPCPKENIGKCHDENQMLILPSDAKQPKKTEIELKNCNTLAPRALSFQMRVEGDNVVNNLDHILVSSAGQVSSRCACSHGQTRNLQSPSSDESVSTNSSASAVYISRARARGVVWRAVTCMRGRNIGRSCCSLYPVA